MLNWLHTLPNFTILLLFVSGAAAICVVAPVYIRRHFKLHVSADVAKGAEEAFKLMSSMTMALLAFCLVQVQTIHRSVEDLAARESTIVVKTDRALTEFGGAQAAIVRGQLRAYAQSVISDEWPVLAKEGRSNATSAALEALARGAAQLQANTPDEQLALSEVRGGMTQISDVREARLAAARLGLAHYFWLAIAAVVIILIVIGWFQGPLSKMIIYVSGVTFGIAVLLTLLVVASGVFVGESRVTPSAISHILPLLARTPAVAGG